MAQLLNNHVPLRDFPRRCRRCRRAHRLLGAPHAGHDLRHARSARGPAAVLQVRAVAEERLVQVPRRRQRRPAPQRCRGRPRRRDAQLRQPRPGARPGRQAPRHPRPHCHAHQRLGRQAPGRRGIRRPRHPVRPNLAARETTTSQVQEETGAILIPPYDHPDIMAGQGTAALELLAEVPDLDAVIAPVGGGGLVSGVSIAAAEFGPTSACLPPSRWAPTMPPAPAPPARASRRPRPRRSPTACSPASASAPGR